MTTVTESGFLTDGMNYIGGEGTGWVLQTDYSGDIEVEVEGVMSQARKFRHHFVTVTGHYTSVDYIARGPSEVLVAESIVPMPDKPA